MLTGKGGLLRARKNLVPRVASHGGGSRVAAERQVVVPVTIEDYMQPEWFDAVTGRPWIARDATGRFVNPWISQAADGVKPLSVLWKWREQRLQRELREFGWNFFIPTFYSTRFERMEATADNDGAAVDTKATIAAQPTTKQSHNNVPLFAKPHRPSTIRFTWIGHATCLIQQGDITILTDPIFSERASPFPRTPIGIARAKPAACTIPELPAYIDVCLISHDHYDHLDKPSVQNLRDRVGLWIVPLGTKEWMTTKGKVPFHKVVEVSWWESVQLVRQQESQNNNHAGDFVVQRHHALRDNPRDDVHPAVADPPNDENQSLWISCLPVQHWCSRTLWDRNYRLWASFAVLLPYRQILYYTGDTALPTQFPLFDQIRSYLPWRIGLAAIPIGAYEPAILNDDSHVNPAEAVQIHQALQPRQSVAIHHGTFPLSEEPLQEPEQWLRRAVVQAGLRPGSFVTMKEGAHLDCPSPTNKLHKRRRR